MTFAKAGLIGILLLLTALVPRFASTFDADPFSKWWSNNVYYVFESSIPAEWYGDIDQAAFTWSTGPADSWFYLGPYYAGATAYGYLRKDETNVWYNCNSNVPACARPAISSGYLYDGSFVATIFDDDVNWVVQGQDDCSANTIRVKNMSLHEFGHWLRLWDQPAGHPEAVMFWGCDNKDGLRYDDRDGAQYLYGTEVLWGSGYGSGGLTSQLLVSGGQPNWLQVSGTANTQYWTARGKGQGVYQLGSIVNAGSNNRWTIDVDVYLNSASGTGWSPQLYLIDTGGRWVKVGWMKDVAYPNTTWFVQSSAGDIYWGNGSSVGNTHHFKFVYNPATKFLSWVVDVTPMWSSYAIPFENPYVLEQGLARAVGDSIDVTFKNFRVTTEWGPN